MASATKFTLSAACLAIISAVAAADVPKLNVERMCRESAKADPTTNFDPKRCLDSENRARDGNYVHMGIATRAFERRFELADFVRVENADMQDGLLSIELVREIPDAMKPRKIDINAGTSRAIEGEAQPQVQAEPQRDEARENA